MCPRRQKPNCQTIHSWWFRKTCFVLEVLIKHFNSLRNGCEFCFLRESMSWKQINFTYIFGNRYLCCDYGSTKISVWTTPPCIRIIWFKCMYQAPYTNYIMNYMQRFYMNTYHNRSHPQTVRKREKTMNSHASLIHFSLKPCIVNFEPIYQKSQLLNWYKNNKCCATKGILRQRQRPETKGVGGKDLINHLDQRPSWAGPQLDAMIFVDPIQLQIFCDSYPALLKPLRIRHKMTKDSAMPVYQGNLTISASCR